MRYGAIAAILALSGCATEGTSIPIGAPTHYAPVEVDQVTLLITPPSRPHVIIALVEGVASTDDYLTEKRTQNAAVAAMKKEAGQLGANAIVLTGKGSQPYAQVTTGTGSVMSAGTFGNVYFSSVSQTAGWQKMRISGTAIRYTD